ncbi:MAG TPA: PLP-dependent cysteine synthase family protein [Verrucomicrobiae bacterium]|nr:PLP-dependent cysteine synthase family protein [Verrucomicrobiae bacterium]
MKSPLQSIGGTPLVRLERLAEPGAADVFLKLESANPTGSMKDRMALSMIEGAERRGEIRPGGRVVDYTGGSTGSSLAMVCAAKGYGARFVSADCFADEKIRTMRAFGAEVEVHESEGGKVTAALIQRLIARSRELASEPGTFWTDQFNNPDNRAGYHGMGREILGALDGRVDAFVMGVGTGGSFSGNAEVLKERLPGIRCVAVEPAASPALSNRGPLGGHRLEGMGAGFVPSICRMDLADEIVAVADDEAYAAARRLAKIEGVFGGISCGANLHAALAVARRLGPGKRVVTVIVDSGLKYLAGDLFR